MIETPKFLTAVVMDGICLIKDGMYMSQLGKKWGITYSHIAKVVYKLDEIGITKTTKSGRVRIIKLTTKGKNVQELILKLNQEFTVTGIKPKTKAKGKAQNGKTKRSSKRV